MLKVKAGDLQKLGLLYERYKKRLFGFYYQMNQNIEVSEDLVQNVFTRILKYKHTYTNDSEFITWMFKIARNVNHDHFKKNKVNYNSVDLNEANNEFDNQKNGFEILTSKENIATLNKAIQKLSSEKREVIILSKFKDLKYKEIGKIIGCSEGNARIKTHRALKDLKTIFNKIEN